MRRLRLTITTLMVVLMSCLVFSQMPVYGKKVKLKAMYPYSPGAVMYDFYKEKIAEFEQENPDIKIEVIWTGMGVMITRLRALLLAGTPPDTWFHNRGDATVSAREGITLRLDEALKGKNYEGDQTWIDTFQSSIIQSAYIRKDEGVDEPGYYAIPEETFVVGIFYNKKIFRKYGLVPPKTWAEFLRVCEILKNRGIAPLAQDGTVNFYNDWWFEYLAQRIVGHEKFYNTALNKSGTSWTDEPGFLEAARKVYELQEKGYFIEGFEGSKWPAAQANWTRGKGAMILMATWLPSEILKVQPPDFEYGFFAFPMVEGGKGEPTCLEVKFNGEVISKESKHIEEAIKYFKFLTSRKVMEDHSLRRLCPATIKGVPFPKQLEDSKKVVEAAKKTVGFHQGLERDGSEWLKRVFRPWDDRLIFGLITPEQFIKELQKAHEKFYAAK